MRHCQRWGLRLMLLVIVLLLGVRGWTVVKQHGHEEKWWDAPPSLDSLDPQEREAAADEVARQYGAKP